MRLDSIIKSLMPKEERYHELLARDTANLVKGARLFKEIADGASLDQRREKAALLKAVERDGDGVTREIFEALNSTFITPLDREDIRSIAMDVDDILDYLEGVGHSLVLFEMADPSPVLTHFADILVAMSEEIERATALLWDLGNAPRIGESIVQISQLENEADVLYNDAIAELFKNRGRDPIDILKWKEIFDGVEDACDECKDFAHILGNVVIKNS